MVTRSLRGLRRRRPPARPGMTAFAPRSHASLEVSRSRLEATCRGSAALDVVIRVVTVNVWCNRDRDTHIPFDAGDAIESKEDTWFKRVLLRTGRVVPCREARMFAA